MLNSLSRAAFSACHVADDAKFSNFNSSENQHRLLENVSTWRNCRTPRGSLKLREKKKCQVAKSQLSDSTEVHLERHVATLTSQETAVDRRSLLVGAAAASTVSKTTNFLCWSNGALAAEEATLLEADVAATYAEVASVKEGVAVGETSQTVAEPGESGADVAAFSNTETIGGQNADVSTDVRSTDGSTDGSPVVTTKVFFDVSIDGRKTGRITVGLFGKDVPIGAARFAELAKGRLGVSYRRKEFIKIYPNYILNAGLRSFSLTGGDRDSAQFTGGETGDKIFAELENLTKENKALKNVPGAVSLIAFDPTIPPPNSKLVAKNGKFIMVEEAVKAPPNGTEFTIITRDAPELDSTNLVVGKVLEGWEVIEEISRVQVVKENTSSPYFMTAKLIGDSRAVVAERGFNRPYSKIMITNCGVL